MACVIASAMANGQILQVAVTAFAKWLDVLKRRIGRRHMLSTDPAWHGTMQLARNRFVDFVAGVAEFAHTGCRSRSMPTTTAA
jgi:hypothetical protein